MPTLTDLVLGKAAGRRSDRDVTVFLNYAEAVGGCTVHYWGDSFRTPDDRLDRWRKQTGIDWFQASALNPPSFPPVLRAMGA